MVLHQTKLQQRAKYRFIKEMTKLQDIHDSDQEREVRRFKFKYGKLTRLTIPGPLMEKQNTTYGISKEQVKRSLLDYKDTKLSLNKQIAMSTSQKVTEED